jgi:hypothetical protein
MPTKRPHLLTLPREIRNIIYSHLYQPFNFDWSYKILPFPQDGYYTVPFQIRNASLLNVLLSCTQIYDEYKENPAIRKPTIALDLGQRLVKRRNDTNSNSETRAKDVLGRTYHVEFHFGTTGINGGVDSWSTIGDFIRIIHNFAPQLRTVEVKSGHGSDCNRKLAESDSTLAGDPVVSGTHPLPLKFDKLAAYCDDGNDPTTYFPSGWKVKASFYGSEGRMWLFEREDIRGQ